MTLLENQSIGTVGARRNVLEDWMLLSTFHVKRVRLTRDDPRLSAQCFRLRLPHSIQHPTQRNQCHRPIQLGPQPLCTFCVELTMFNGEFTSSATASAVCRLGHLFCYHLFYSRPANPSVGHHGVIRKDSEIEGWERGPRFVSDGTSKRY